MEAWRVAGCLDGWHGTQAVSLHPPIHWQVASATLLETLLQSVPAEDLLAPGRNSKAVKQWQVRLTNTDQQAPFPVLMVPSLGSLLQSLWPPP